MGRRRKAELRAREATRRDRRWKIRFGAFFVALAVALLTKDTWAGGFDELIGLLGDGATAAALVGWLAGFSWLAYGLLVLAARRRWARALDRTWPVGMVLFVPFLTLQPSRTRRSEAVHDEYWYLGSFFDTYDVALLTVFAAGATGVVTLWLSTRGDQEDMERPARLFAVAGRLTTAVVAAGTVGTLGWAIVGF
ncbi:hypothetical protein [Aeromicrobium wangtongii]|uniref:hypothetical protein n=1 Tax=Aeromicrobium wangtongii TaxID=2969247 RepID=UPI002016D3FE|nr:hypothetical protein [Aeromicrobium wangtongii]MCL3818978.1 hypothetical protein [Aeromicrobium wangtongii]